MNVNYQLLTTRPDPANQGMLDIKNRLFRKLSRWFRKRRDAAITPPEQTRSIHAHKAPKPPPTT